MRIERDAVAVITGGASGIGLGLAEALAARGARLVLADIREEALAPAVEALEGAGAEIVAVPTDVGDAASVGHLASATIEAFGRVDLVCNNAGLVSPGAPLWEQDPRTWEQAISVKLLGVVHGVRAFAPILVRQGAGHFLNTASSGGLAPLPGRTPYTTTMHAVVGLTETLDVELKQESPELGATVLCPGLVDTPLGQNSAALGAIELSPDAPSMQSVAAKAGGILTPREVAESAIAAIEAGCVHVAPGHGVLDRARARVDALLADLAATS